MSTAIAPARWRVNSGWRITTATTANCSLATGWTSSAWPCRNTGLVHFENGATMSLESNWLMHPGGRSSGGELLGDLGVASLRPLRIELEEGGDIVDVTPALPADESVADRCGNIIHDLCQSVLEDRLPLVRFEQLLDVQRIMNGLYDAAEQGREVEIAA